MFPAALTPGCSFSPLLNPWIVTELGPKHGNLSRPLARSCRGVSSSVPSFGGPAAAGTSPHPLPLALEKKTLRGFNPPAKLGSNSPEIPCLGCRRARGVLLDGCGSWRGNGDAVGHGHCVVQHPPGTGPDLLSCPACRCKRICSAFGKSVFPGPRALGGASGPAETAVLRGGFPAPSSLCGSTFFIARQLQQLSLNGLRTGPRSGQTRRGEMPEMPRASPARCVGHCRCQSPLRPPALPHRPCLQLAALSSLSACAL